MPGISLLSQSSTNTIILHTIPSNETFLLTQMIDCMYLMPISNIVPPFQIYVWLDFLSYSFFLFLFDLLVALVLIIETLWLFFCPMVGGNIPCSLHTMTRLFHWLVCTLYLTRFETLIGSKENGPTNTMALSPKSGSKVDHWMNLELHGVTEGLILILSP